MVMLANAQPHNHLHPRDGPIVMVLDSTVMNVLPGDAPAKDDGEEGVVLAGLPAAGEAVA